MPLGEKELQFEETLIQNAIQRFDDAPLIVGKLGIGQVPEVTEGIAETGALQFTVLKGLDELAQLRLLGFGRLELEDVPVQARAPIAIALQ